MTISTLILVLLLTVGAASALDRLVQSHWLHEALMRVGLWDAIPAAKDRGKH